MINIGVAAFVDDINFVPVFVHPLDGNRNGHTALREQYDLMKSVLPLHEGMLMTVRHEGGRDIPGMSRTPCYVRDEGRSLGIGLQDRVPNHLKLQE